MSLENRVISIREKMQQFGIDQGRVAVSAGLARVSVAKALSATKSDPRYLTEGNITAIEKGIDKILDEYRQQLCGK